MPPSLLIAPLEALVDTQLTDPERRVLLSLYSFRNKNADTVWPSLEKIAERANIADQTRVSKLTKSLSEKGWLTKRKKGFTGGNEYVLSVPDRLDHDANLDSDAKLDGDTNSNLDSDTKSNLDSESKCNEQQIEQQTEQQKSIAIYGFDLGGWPSLPDQPVFREWVAMRKAIKKPVSQRAVDRMASKLAEAVSNGMTVDDALGEAIDKRWQGFDYRWTDQAKQPPTFDHVVTVLTGEGVPRDVAEDYYASRVSTDWKRGGAKIDMTQWVMDAHVYLRNRERVTA